MKQYALLCCALAFATGCEPASLSASQAVPTVTAELPGDTVIDPPVAPIEGQEDVAPALPGEGEDEEEVPAEVPPPPPAPALKARVDLPARGARVFGATIRVEGVYTNAANPVIDINGIIVPPSADRRFSVEVPAHDGLNLIVTQITDGENTIEDRRSVMNNADVDPNSEVARAVVVGISRDGFSAVSRLLSQVLGQLDFSTLLNGQAPEDFEITELTVGSVDLELLPIDGALQAQFRIYGLQIGLRGRVRVLGIPISVRASAGADPAEIVATLSIDDDGIGGMNIQMQSAEVSLQNFGYNIRNVPGEIEQWFEGRVRRMGEGMIEDALQGIVIPKLFDPNSLNQTIDVLDTQIDLGMGIEDITVDWGGMDLALTASAAAAAVVNQGNAVRTTGMGQPSPQDAHIDLAIAADFVNRILHSMWAGGALNLALGGEDAAGDSPIPLTLQILKAALGEAAEGLDPSTPLEIGVRALLPPVARVDAQGEHPIIIEAGALLIDIGVPGERLVTLAIDAVIGVSLNVNPETGEVEPDMSIEVNADVAETPRGPVNDKMIETLMEGLAGALPGLIGGDMNAEGADPMGAPLPIENTRLTAEPGIMHLLLDLAL